MKLILESPYKELYEKGYIVINKENRTNVILYNSHNDRSTVSYARYLMSVKLGRFLKENEHVDHKDEDKTNDDPGNLQILSQAENNKKYRDTHGIKRKTVIMTCPTCGEDFVKFQNHLYNPRKKCFCSRSCAAKFYQLHDSRKRCFCSRSCGAKFYKSAKTQTRICEHCRQEFTRPERYFRRKEKIGTRRLFCSRSCSTSFYNRHSELGVKSF